MRSIKSIQDVVDWGLCVGCGACYYFCDKDAVSLSNYYSAGIRPRFRTEICRDCMGCLSICPGYSIEATPPCSPNEQTKENLLVGPTLEIWEGYAKDEEIRYRGSSGGVLTALSLFCLEKENMEFILHTAMNPLFPWENLTVQSRDRDDLLARTGSRYAPSSPCDSLKLIEQSKKPCVFIGKPCDTAAVSKLRKMRPKLDANLGLVLAFFCAGPPATQGTLNLLRRLNIEKNDVNELYYRGEGWPGSFKVIYNNKTEQRSLTYKESWGSLAKNPRSFRCHLCPDGLGEIADISCGDAWHKDTDNGDAGLSLILVRSPKGKDLLHRAARAGYVTLGPSSSSEVIKAQVLVKRRSLIFGRLLAMRILLVPTPKFLGFPLLRTWIQATSLFVKVRTILGTLRRLIKRNLWRPNPCRGNQGYPKS